MYPISVCSWRKGELFKIWCWRLHKIMRRLLNRQSSSTLPILGLNKPQKLFKLVGNNIAFHIKILSQLYNAALAQVDLMPYLYSFVINPWTGRRLYQEKEFFFEKNENSQEFNGQMSLGITWSSWWITTNKNNLIQSNLI